MSTVTGIITAVQGFPHFGGDRVGSFPLVRMRCRTCKESVSGVEPLACACTGATAELEPFYLFKLAIAAGGSRMEGVVFDDIAVEVIGVDASVYTEVREGADPRRWA